MVPYGSPMRLTVHRVPFSTNVERVALAAAHKGIAIDWIDHPNADRSAIRALSGQDFVPVLEDPDGSVVVDSPVILARLEALVPEPPLWPRAPRERAAADIFLAWFNRVWKRAPNAIAAAGDPAASDPALAAELRGSLALFEGLLEGREHLLSDAFGVADVIAFPFLKYAVRLQPDDPDPFHHVLHRELALGDEHPRLAAWIARVDARPRA